MRHISKLYFKEFKMAFKKFMLIFLSIMMISTDIFAAGSSVVATDPVILRRGMFGDGDIATMTLTFTADDTDGSFPSYTMTESQTGTVRCYWLSHVKITPGTTGPTDNSDITVTWGGVDILGGNGSNIVNNATSGYCVPYGSSGQAQFPMIGEQLTISITGNAVNSATVGVTLVFDK